MELGLLNFVYILDISMYTNIVWNILVKKKNSNLKTVQNFKVMSGKINVTESLLIETVDKNEK
jgi:hypothetical protein